MARKILVVSLGSIGQRHLRNARSLLPGAQIGVFRQSAPASAKVPEGADAIFHDLQSALAFKPDAVIIASPANLHIGNAKAFLGIGAHLFIEKPLAAAGKDLAGFEQAVRSSSAFVMVGYVLRFLPVLHSIRNLIREERIGKVRTAHVQVGQYLPDWRPSDDYRKGVSAQAALGGGALLELSHEIDYSLWLFGRPQALQCSLGKVGGLDIDVEDSAHIVLEYASPAKRVLIQLDFLQRVANMALQIVGSEGNLEADLINETVRIITPGKPQGEAMAVPTLANGNEIYLRQFDFFFTKSFADYEPVFPETSGFEDWATVDQAADVLALVDQAKVADDQGRRMDLGRKA